MREALELEPGMARGAGAAVLRGRHGGLELD
jgi:hypothetical protein